MQKRTLAPKLVAGALILSLGISAMPNFRYTPAVNIVYAAESDFAFDAAAGRITAYKGADQNVNIPDTIEGTAVTEIGYEAFSGNSTLTDISMPGTITAIGSMAFEGCTGLNRITIPSGVTTIAPYTFYGCSGLTSVSLPSSVSTIMLEAFGGCTNLTSIILPEGVATLEDEAFAACSSLNEITIPASVTSIGAKAFDGCDPDLKIIAPADSYAKSYAEANHIQFQDKQETTENMNNGIIANKVVTLISQIGVVTLESEPYIVEARNAYDALTPEQRALVTNYTTLVEAEIALTKLKQENMPPDEKEQANQAAAKLVMDKIALIGSVTLDSQTAISNARTAYDVLTSEQKSLVTNYEVLKNAETAYAELKEAFDNAEKAEADKLAASAVIESISLIGEVTLESESAIIRARNAYNALTSDQKRLVSNYTVLSAAEDTLAQLKKDAELDEQEKTDRAAANLVMLKIEQLGYITLDSEEDIRGARDAYDALTPEQQALVTNYDVLTNAENSYKELKEAFENAEKTEADKLAASTVSDLITQIGTVTLDSEAAIVRARDAYNGLTADQKALVRNYTTLTAAEHALEELKNGGGIPDDKDEANQAAANLVMTKIERIGYITLNSESDIYTARTAYDALTSEQKSLVTNYDVLVNAEHAYADMKEAFDKAQKAEADNIAASAVIDAISQIGSVSLNSEPLIVKARSAYNALTNDQKALVINYDVLTSAEAALTQIKSSAPSDNLSLTNTTATLYTKGKKTLTLSAAYNGTKLSGAAVTWISSNPKIASVKNGKITAKKKGNITISATYKGITVKCTVTVKKPTLKLKKTKATLKVGKKVKIRATATPAKKITYKSNNKKVATVSKKGMVTAKGIGKAKITVTSNGVKKKFTVTVKE